MEEGLNLVMAVIIGVALVIIAGFIISLVANKATREAYIKLVKCTAKCGACFDGSISVSLAGGKPEVEIKGKLKRISLQGKPQNFTLYLGYGGIAYEIGKYDVERETEINERVRVPLEARKVQMLENPVAGEVYDVNGAKIMLWDGVIYASSNGLMTINYSQIVSALMEKDDICSARLSPEEAKMLADGFDEVEVADVIIFRRGGLVVEIENRLADCSGKEKIIKDPAIRAYGSGDGKITDLPLPAQFSVFISKGGCDRSIDTAEEAANCLEIGDIEMEEEEVYCKVCALQAAELDLLGPYPIVQDIEAGAIDPVEGVLQLCVPVNKDSNQFEFLNITLESKGLSIEDFVYPSIRDCMDDLVGEFEAGRCLTRDMRCGKGGCLKEFGSGRECVAYAAKILNNLGRAKCSAAACPIGGLIGACELSGEAWIRQ